MINQSKVNITAHAGCMGTRMDSIESIETGLKCGADILEIDLNIDENGNLVICHDKPKPQNKYVSFNEILEIIKNNQRILLNIDIKDVKVLVQLKKVIQEYDVKHRVFYTGLNFQQIMENKDKLISSNYFINLEQPKLDITQINNEGYLRELLNELVLLNIMGININHRLASSEIIRVCKEIGILSSVWTVDTVEEMGRMLSLKVNSITTKRVDLLKSLVE